MTGGTLRVGRLREWCRDRKATLLLAALTGVAVYLIGEGVFPHYTSNHDEAVYLQQAEMLLEGQLTLEPPVAESFRPWFFVAEDGHLYPRYTPVTAGLFALGGLVGSYRFALAVLAGLAVALTRGVVGEVFEERTGLFAAGLLAVSPLFVVQAAVFLPYVPAFVLNLLFAWAYLRADRTGDRRLAALAGGAIGLSFWARPYTAVLFATPFLCHALWTLRTLDGKTVGREGLTAALGLAGVAVALGYNAVLTGDPLLFPYEAFAPRDGLGFGRRQLLEYERNYTPALALEATARNLRQFGTQWAPGGLVGTAVAALGAVAVLRRPQQRTDPRVLAVLGTLATITVGNVYFWGTLNVLGTLSDPNDGLIAVLGPYYHVGLLLPLVTLGAVGITWLGGIAVQFRRRLGEDGTRALAAVGVVAMLVVAGVTVGAIAVPLADNYRTTQQYERAYEPVERHSFDRGLVFLPTPYGNWLNHPFQSLRNDPDFDGEVVYALQHREFAVVDAVPDRTLYRYTYRGEWAPSAGRSVTPRLRRIDHVSGRQVRLDLTMGVPDAVEVVELRASVDGEGDSTAAALTDEIDVTVVAVGGNVSVRSPSFEQNLTVAHDDGSPVRVVAYVDYGALGGFEYVTRLPLVREDGQYRALSPYLEVCRAPSRCGGEAAYVPGEHRAGVSMNATLSAGE
jgi:hypothetical protein